MKVLLSLLLLFLPLWADAQSVMTGRVSDAETKEALDKAIVKILNDKRQLIAYTVTGREGDYSLKFNSPLPKVFVSVHYLGYRTHTEEVENKSRQKDFALHSEAVNLKEVHVKPRAIAKYGDTLDYNVSSFKMEQDRTISDILKRMPGITIGASGNISYMGKAINKFYIEGLDLLGRRYNLASTSIPADAVSTVQVLENHQPVKALQKVAVSDRAALNLVLKEKSRIRPVGYAEGGLGAMEDEALWNANVFALSVAPRNQSLISYKGNNTGNPLSDLAMGVSVSAEDLSAGLNLAPVNLFSGFSFGALPTLPERYAFNRSHLVNYNNLWKSGENQWRVSASYLNEKNKQRIYTDTDYLLPDEAHYVVTEDKATDLRDNKLTLGVELERNTERLYLSNSTEGYGDWVTHDYTLANHALNRWQKLKMPTFAVQNNLKIIKTIDRNTLNLYSYVRYLNQPQELKVKETETEDRGMLRQKAERATLYAVGGGSFARRFRSSSVGLGVRLKATWDDYESANNNPYLLLSGYDAENDFYGGEYVASLSPYYTYKKGRFNLRLTLPVSFHAYDWRNRCGGEDDLRLWNVEPEGTFRYDLDDRWSVSFNYSHRRQLGDLMDFVDAPVMRDYLYVKKGAGILEKRTSDSYIFHLGYRDEIDALFFNLSAVYRPMRLNTLSGTTLEDDYILTYRTECANDMDMLTFSASLAKYIDALRTNVKVFGAYDNTSSSQYQQGRLYPLDTDTYQCQLMMDSKVASWLNVDANVRWQKSILEDGENDRRSTWRLSGKLAGYFIPMKKLFFSVSGEYGRLHNRQKRDTRFFFLDAKANYKTGRWETELAWQNILDKSVYENISHSDLYTTYVSFPLRTSNVLVSLRYNF